MLKVRLYDRMGGESQVIEARVVIVETAYGDPVLLGLETGEEDILVVSHIQDPDFKRLLHSLGFDRTTILDVVHPAPLPAGAERLELPLR